VSWIFCLAKVFLAYLFLDSAASKLLAYSLQAKRRHSLAQRVRSARSKTRAGEDIRLGAPQKSFQKIIAILVLIEDISDADLPLYKLPVPNLQSVRGDSKK